MGKVNGGKSYPYTTHSYRAAVDRHRQDGGYLLNLGYDGKGIATYTVCDEAMARDGYGRTPEGLAALAPTYRERR